MALCRRAYRKVKNQPMKAPLTPAGMATLSTSRTVSRRVKGENGQSVEPGRRARGAAASGGGRAGRSPEGIGSPRDGRLPSGAPARLRRNHRSDEMRRDGVPDEADGCRRGGAGADGNVGLGARRRDALARPCGVGNTLSGCWRTATRTSAKPRGDWGCTGGRSSGSCRSTRRRGDRHPTTRGLSSSATASMACARARPSSAPGFTEQALAFTPPRGWRAHWLRG